MNAVLAAAKHGSAAAGSPLATVSRRYLALWLPFLPTDRLRAAPLLHHRLEQPDNPVAVVEKERGALRLVAVDEPAARLGLHPGMALAQALALAPGLSVVHAKPDDDAALLAFLAEAATRFSPLVALDGTDGLLIDITGCAHLFDGEQSLLRAARRLAGRMGLTSKAAIASTPDCAHAIARFTQGGVAPPGQEERIARALPLAALEVDRQTALALTRSGFKTLADLADRPSHGLTARFGADLMTRLEGVLGHADRRITPLRTPPLMVAERHFAEPVALLESLMAALAELAHDITAMLEARWQGGRAFEAVFFRADGAVRRLTIETAQPARDSQALMRLLRLKIETLADPIDPGFGFDAVRLIVTRSEDHTPHQAHLAQEKTAENEATAAALVDRLVTRFGRENALRFVTRDTHAPERAGALASCLACATSASAPERATGEPPTRPLTIFPHPHPIEAIAEVPDGPPIRFRWRRVMHDVTRAEGPERIAPEWWRAQTAWRAARDYYRVEDAKGHRFWLFREGLYGQDEEPRWFLQGLFA